MDTNSNNLDATQPTTNGSGIEQTVNSDLQTAPAAEPDPTTFTVEGSKTATAEPLLIELPFFLRWQVADQQRTTNLLAAIAKVFNAFDQNEGGIKLMDKDINQYLAYHALRLSVEQLVKKAATKRLGSFIEPTSRDYLFVMPELAINDPELDNAPVFDDPTTCTDMDKLHEWVSTLQQMTRLQMKIAANNQKVDEIQQKTIDDQAAQIDNLQRLVKLEEQVTAATATKAYEQTVPKALNYIDLTLYLAEGYDSETELVREALTDMAKEKLEKVLQKIVNDETEEAFYFKEDYNKIQNVLARLSLAVTEQASDSFARNDYQSYPSGYQLSETKNRKNLDQRKAKFIKAYSVYSQDEEADEQTEPQTVEPNSAA